MATDALENFSAGFLTERLRASGVLPRGRVLAVDAGERRTTIVSTIAPLRVAYSSDAPAEAPTRLFLKATRGGLDPGLRSVGEREVAFYRYAAPLMPDGAVPRCYDAEFIDGSFHLLLEDLSETHAIITTWPLPPSDEACECIIDTWGELSRVLVASPEPRSWRGRIPRRGGAGKDHRRVSRALCALRRHAR